MSFPCNHRPPGRQLHPKLNTRFNKCLDPHTIYVDEWVDNKKWSCECGYNWVGKNISWKLMTNEN